MRSCPRGTAPAIAAILCNILVSELACRTNAFVFSTGVQSTSVSTCVGYRSEGGRGRAYFALKMSDYQPSDSSAEELYEPLDVKSSTYEPTLSQRLVSVVINELPDTMNGDVPLERRATINEALLKLEAVNPTNSPSTSLLLNGVWTLKYAGGYDPYWALPSPTRQLALFLYSGGYSPGLFAMSLAQNLPSSLVEVGNLCIAISRTQPRVEAKVGVKLFGSTSESEVVVRARLDVESEVRLRETYESASLLARDIDLPSQAQYSRELFVTYVDEDVLIVRDGSGVPEVLVRN